MGDHKRVSALHNDESPATADRVPLSRLTLPALSSIGLVMKRSVACIAIVSFLSVFANADEESWKLWNEKNIRLLSVTQQPDGSWAGNRGPSYSTASALLSLALNYRLLPIYEK